MTPEKKHEWQKKILVRYLSRDDVDLPGYSFLEMVKDRIEDDLLAMAENNEGGI